MVGLPRGGADRMDRAVREGWGMVERRPEDPDDGREADVLGSYLEVLRGRLEGEHFEAVVRAVHTTCALLGEGLGKGSRAVLPVAAEGLLAPELQREYLSLMAVMITGHLDHRLVEVAAPGGGTGWAVVENTPVRRVEGPADPGRGAAGGGPPQDTAETGHRPRRAPGFRPGRPVASAGSASVAPGRCGTDPHSTPSTPVTREAFSDTGDAPVLSAGSSAVRDADFA
ncbi:hypothetical protein [Streptomyces sp. NPDC058674]|uniref:hypothetical protein n=1 Tax=Streptomyces sp. NPDC058674 TaxID=3346592 RepID=UPI00364C2068